MNLNQGTEISCTLLIRLGQILESVALPSLFTMIEHAIANVYLDHPCLDLSFLLRVMFVKIYFYKLAFALKRYKLM